MNILLAAGEMEPLVGAGQPAHALFALSSELQQLGHKVSVVLPFYHSLLQNNQISPKSTGVCFSVPVGAQWMSCEIFEIQLPHGIQVFFVARDEFFNRTESNGQGFQDNAARFAFYGRCVLELARRISPLPNIVQCHDWQAALIPVMAHEARLPFKTVLSISSLEHQGNFWSHDFAFTSLPNGYFSATGLEFYGSLNLLKGGILFSDAVVLPSKRYVAEAQRPEYGCGLDSIFQKNSEKLHDISYGLDAAIWNPETDPHIRKSYSASDQNGKSLCLSELLSSLRLAPFPKGPTLVMMNELVTAEGFDLFLPILDRLLTEDVRLIALGNAREYHTLLKVAAHKHNSQFVYQSSYKDNLIHQLFAGADIFLLPSEIELTGISVMKALKYGCVPIVRACSGFYQWIQNDTGFIFYDHTSEALLDSIRQAVATFEKKEDWNHIVVRAMSQDFSWKSSAKQYETLYAFL